MTSVSPDNKTLARIVARVFGGNSRVTRYWDDNNISNIDILTSENSPQIGVTSLSTIGLSDSPLMKDGAEFKVRLEIVGACGSGFNNFDNVLATAAFCIINSKCFCAPGTIFPDIIAMYNASRTTKHLLFVPPFLWEDELQTLDLSTKKVAWLLAIPISDEERRFAELEGSDRLEDLFVENQIDIFNLDRPSIL